MWCSLGFDVGKPNEICHIIALEEIPYEVPLRSASFSCLDGLRPAAEEPAGYAGGDACCRAGGRSRCGGAGCGDSGAFLAQPAAEIVNDRTRTKTRIS